MNDSIHVKRPRKDRIARDLFKLSEITDPRYKGWTRLAFTEIYNQGRRWIRNQMTAAGLDTSMDAAANLIGRLEGENPGFPPLIIGSHTDTVINGGRYDGTAGVLAGIEIARLLSENNIRLRHTLEIIDFTAEEPTSFGISTIGSKAIAGNLSGEMLELKDPNGRTLAQAIKAAGGSPAHIPGQHRRRGDIAAYLELHIEQGPVLEQTGKELGVVRGIVGIDRFFLRVTGSPDHSGTTPMGLRRDSLAGAAEMILALERLCGDAAPGSLVGTIGKIQVSPNAANVVAGETVLDAEIRSLDNKLMVSTAEQFLSDCTRIAERRGLSLLSRRMSHTSPVVIDPIMMGTVQAACSQVSGKWMELTSGAGHDANQMACIAPVGMIFVPSAGGRSHCPEEYTDIINVVKGTEALLGCILQLDTHNSLHT